jgi:hypothetical protein
LLLVDSATFAGGLVVRLPTAGRKYWVDIASIGTGISINSLDEGVFV